MAFAKPCMQCLAARRGKAAIANLVRHSVSPIENEWRTCGSCDDVCSQEAVSDRIAQLELDPRGACSLARRGEAKRQLGHFEVGSKDILTGVVASAQLLGAEYLPDERIARTASC